MGRLGPMSGCGRAWGGTPDMGVGMQKCLKDKISVAMVQKDAFGELLVILRCLVTKDWAVPLGCLPSPG